LALGSEVAHLRNIFCIKKPILGIIDDIYRQFLGGINAGEQIIRHKKINKLRLEKSAYLDPLA